ncbi:response regulator transcription factor [Paenibacillus spiritus]|uniref:Response regulator transcription factor n=1 Tax=Paenibacillus spiritus TaxID=2496557 RepID=A0A5J5GJ91_9BACL|nr:MULTISPECIES: response regulator transcription factor [Paenibacillus]KAA9007564.1 response regulator transcription factor [Paenibacillus spiritus]
MNKPFILVVEDDRPIRKLITTTLETQGYRYQTAETGEASIIEAVSRQPDLMVLDLGLPDMDGVDIIRKVRAWSNLPIIVVSARSEDRDKIEALDAGADDYLTKPFSVEELLARLRVSLRRIRNDSDKLQRDASRFVNGPLRIDYSAGCVWVDEEEIHLTPSEYKLLCLLAKNSGKVLTHNYILRAIWGNHPYDVPALRVFMATLRKKIEKGSGQPKLIQTHIGIGYRMLQVGEES